MRIGTVFALPMEGSKYATVKDEYDNRRTIYATDLDEDHEEEDDYAYQVDFWSGGGVHPLNREPEEDPGWPNPPPEDD